MFLFSKVQGAVQAEAEEVMQLSEAAVRVWRSGDDIWEYWATGFSAMPKNGMGQGVGGGQ